MGTTTHDHHDEVTGYPTPPIREVQQCASPSPWHTKPAASGALDLFDIYAGHDEVVCDATPEDAEFLTVFDPEMVGLLLDVAEAAQRISFPSNTAAEFTVDGFVGAQLKAALDRLAEACP